MPAILGKKLGMTRIFTDDGEAVPVTVITRLAVDVAPWSSVTV